MKHYIPDYPRPQMVRPGWQNLNGIWDFAFDDENLGMEQKWFQGVPQGRKIQVPFTYETPASGIGEETFHPRVWYSRTIQVEKETLEEKRLMLHFEGCDYETQVWVNGVHMGSHIGGYARFSFDITPAARPGENLIAVMAADSNDPRQPRGKQRWQKENFGCWYVQTTGIWKTVWLEEGSPRSLFRGSN